MLQILATYGVQLEYKDNYKEADTEAQRMRLWALIGLPPSRIASGDIDAQRILHGL